MKKVLAQAFVRDCGDNYPYEDCELCLHSLLAFASSLVEFCEELFLSFTAFVLH
jgi:hypothetical protein